MKRHIANVLTGLRILAALMILYFPVFSLPFFIFYIFGGLTDIIDGTVARMTGSATDIGSKLDSAADLIFAVSALVKILPVLDIPLWLWIWILAIALIKCISIIRSFTSYGRVLVEHTLLNKITGLLLFILPLTLTFADLKFTGAFVCCVATAAAIQEGYNIRCKKEVI